MALEVINLLTYLSHVLDLYADSEISKPKLVRQRLRSFAELVGCNHLSIWKQLILHQLIGEQLLTSNCWRATVRKSLLTAEVLILSAADDHR